MSNSNNNKNNFVSRLAGKGYYIALVLCAVAIGVSGYLYYRNTNDRPQLEKPGPTVDVMNPGDDNPQNPTTPTNGTQPTKKPFRTGKPVDGEVVMDYAMDCLSYNPTTRDWRVHDGMDIAAQAGTTVCAAAAGTVYTTYTDDSMGTTVVIRHEGGYTTRYASLAEELHVGAGDTVKMGQAIGCVGSTALVETAVGPHVHFCVTYRDAQMDPAEFLALGQ